MTRKSLRDLAPTSYEEFPDDVEEDSENDFMPHSTRSSRKRERNGNPEVKTRSGRSVKKPETMYKDDRPTERRTIGRRTPGRQAKSGKSLSTLHLKRGTRSSSRSNTSDDDNSDHRNSVSDGDRMDEDEMSYDEEPAPALRRSRRLSGSGSEKDGGKELPQRRSPRISTDEPKVPMRVRLRNRPGQGSNVEAAKESIIEEGDFEPAKTSNVATEDAKLSEKHSSSDEANEPPIKRSLRSSIRKSVVDDDDNIEPGDEEFKLPEEESDDDDDFEANDGIEESDLNSSENQAGGMRTRSSNKRRLRSSSPVGSSKVRRSSTRAAASSRNARRSGSGYGNSRKSYPKRTVRRAARPRSDARSHQRGGNDALGTYRPRRNNLRPSDFYQSESSSGDSSSSEDDFMRAPRASKGTHSPRAPATENQAPDFLTNPMAVIDLGNARPSRYARRRNRTTQNGRDPFPIDVPGSARGPRSASKLPPIEPIKVDLNLSWKDVGGLDHHVRALKEMVFLPLMYPEVFEKFKIDPPKGVLFYGPPGTGKTLCARTLAASCGDDPDDEKLPEPIPSMLSLPNACKEIAAEHNNGTKAPRTQCSDDSNIPNGARNAPGNIPVPDGFIVACDENKKTTKAPAVTIELNLSEGETAAIVKSKKVIEAAANLLNEEKNEATSTPDKPSAVVDSQPEVTDTSTKRPRRPRVAFFMRNGADCLSKWVGEAERQLRMTFEAAKRHQPAIIFFDEIDGLAPVRSSRQDQIHSSIVSTLLGLMDGLDSRGKIVVIGATNRVDAIDPALRRPGRFDRELIFTLPNGKARRRILEIQTKNWKPSPPPSKILDLIAERTVGYCGADLRSLCTEAALRALRRRYPQIYNSQDKLLINVDSVRISTRDFIAAMNEIVPASHRSARTHARPIDSRLSAVLLEPLNECILTIKRIFPQGITPSFAMKTPEPSIPNGPHSEFIHDDDIDLSDDVSDYDEGDVNDDEFCNALGSKGRSVYGRMSSSLYERPVLRPRLLVCGRPGLGQAQLGPALLHFLEGCPVHAIDMPSLHTNSSSRSPEEALVIAVREACRAVPAVLYLPHLHLWWETANESLRTTLLISLRDIPADLPLLFLAVAEEDLNALPTELSQLFLETVTLEPSKTKQREEMFRPLIQQAITCPKVSHAALKRKRINKLREVLPKAPQAPVKPVTKEESLRQIHEEDKYIRVLRMEMRAFVEQLLRDRKFKVFWRPVDPTTAPDYYQIIKEPMAISKIAAQVDKGMYPTVLAMVRDFDLMVKNALEYNPAHTEEGAAILRRAHGLVDIVHAWADNLNPLLVEQCNRIVAARIAKATAQKEEQAKILREGPKQSQAHLRDRRDSTNVVCRMDIDEPSAPTTSGVAQEHLGVEGAHRSGDARMDVENAPEQRVVDHPPGNVRQERANGMRNGEGGGSVPPFEEEPYVPAEAPKVEVLRHLIVTVTSGISVDGLEGLHVRCATLLHKLRRSRNRAQVVDNLTNVVMEAREDPAVVGNLVE